MLGPLPPVRQLPVWGTGLAGELLLCLWLFCQVFAHRLVTASPLWSRATIAGCHFSLPGPMWSHTSPVCSASTLESLTPSEQRCSPCSPAEH